MLGSNFTLGSILFVYLFFCLLFDKINHEYKTKDNKIEQQENGTTTDIIITFPLDRGNKPHI